ncbi:MAG: hypothetical protein ACXADY_18365 [Candidatus Hodarchaeales archaeon]|jgi:hypothetical protein
MPDVILNLGADAVQEPAFVQKATDPVVSNVATPGDFAAQFPQPLNTNEIIAMCEEVNLWRSLPEIPNSLNAETYREMNEMAFTSGSSYVAFTDGECPEEYEHDGDNTTISHKNIGAKKSLTIRDIMHSAAVVGMSQGRFGVGISDMVGAFPSGEGLPGGSDAGTFGMQGIANLKAKEMLLASVLVLNGWDRLLALGDAAGNALEFDGIELLVSSGTGAHYNLPASISGSFSAADFDRFLSESCAKPTAVFGHPTAIQEMMSGYFQLGFQGSQYVTHSDGNRLIPGYNFAGEVFTGVGRLQVVADANFTRTNLDGTTFQSNLFALRMSHNGEPLVYKSTQVPLAFQDLAPGCTAISFQIWAATALIIKARCAQGRYTKAFTGRITTTCPVVGLTND